MIPGKADHTRPVAPQLSAGSVVTLRARGPVFAWPAD